MADRSGDSLIDGGPDRDVIDTGGRGDRLVLGGPGPDGINSSDGGNVVLRGEAGNDSLFAGGGTLNRLVGGSGDDELSVFAAPRQNVLAGGEGDDELDAAGADDVLRGGPGADALYGGSGDDSLDGGTDFDSAYFGNPDTFRSLDANLSTGVATGYGTDALIHIEGLDVVGQGDDVLVGDDEDNLLVGSRGDDTIDGGDGLDTASFFSRCIFWCGDYGPVTADLGAGTASGQGSDTLVGIEDLGGSQFADTLIGDAGPNRLYGLGRRDDLAGLEDDDLLDGGLGLDAGNGGSQITADTCISIESPTDCE